MNSLLRRSASLAAAAAPRRPLAAAAILAADSIRRPLATAAAAGGGVFQGLGGGLAGVSLRDPHFSAGPIGFSERFAPLASPVSGKKKGDECLFPFPIQLPKITVESGGESMFDMGGGGGFGGSLLCTKLLSMNAHLGRRVAAHHLKIYISGFRNGIAILDSDKTLLCLRNALHFIGSLIRQKGRLFFFKTKNRFLHEIMEEMVSYMNESQWRIGSYLNHSSSSSLKKIRSRKKKINEGLNLKPDCLVILDTDRTSSIILEAHRSQIPIVSLVSSTIHLGSYQRITYPIPANDSIQFVYLFCHLLTKTVILEQGKKRCDQMIG